MFDAGEQLVLSLWDRAAFEAEVGGPALDGPGVVPMTLAHNVATPAEVRAVLALAAAAGAPVTGPVEREWGGFTGYFADPDGFRWEVAWNPGPIGLRVVPRHRRRRSPVSGVRPRRTERLVLRGWRDGDRDVWTAMNADPEVMRYFHDTMTREQSDAMLDRMDAALAQQGWGLWALERQDTGELIGFTGLAVPVYDLPFTPCVEVGWRLARSAWGRGFATEAAREALRVGFDEVGLREVVSLTSVPNTPSRAVMERLGMSRDPGGDFEHPAVPVGHPLRSHVLYRIRADAVR